ncbi:MAG TPA: adenosylcobinamide-GDP ribazoletransferase [Candidatus Binataceae bacterium]|nr:adenosylcobinamide-GDP ribazoletransferase [Candidatus Binataceae bacterium]
MPDPSKADPLLEVEPRHDFLRQAWLAAGACTRWIPPPCPRAAAPAEEHARALVFVPVVGMIIGVAMALCDRALSAIFPLLPTSAITIVAAVLLTGGLLPIGVARTVAQLIAGKSPRHVDIGWSGAAAPSLILGAEIFALNMINAPPARARALVLAMLLSRWAIVPIGYGLKALEEGGLGIAYFGGITFAEFGISSVIALSLAMGLYDVVGLAAIVAVALTILGLRLLLSRRLGGVGGDGLSAGAAVCETITLAILAAISRI